MFSNRCIDAEAMDQPSNFGNIRFLARVRPHPIRKDPQLVDPYIESSFIDLYGTEPLEQFKYFTKSFYTLEGHYDHLWKYDRLMPPEPDFNRNYKIALAHTSKCMRLPEPVTSFAWNELAQVPFIPSSAAGWNYVGKKGDPGNHSSAISRAHYNLCAWREAMTGGVHFKYPPHLAYTRTQLGHIDKPKIRNVWGQSFDNIILEGLSAAPLIQGYQSADTPIASGFQLYKRLPLLIRECLTDGDELALGVGTDYSAFDACAPPWLIKRAFAILRENIIFPDIWSEYAWRYSIQHFISKPICMPDGRLWLVKSGIPSGSYFTQLIGSIINHILTSYVQLSVHGKLYKTYVLGDDSIFGLPYCDIHFNDFKVYAELYSKSVSRTFGYTINAQKSIMATSPTELTFLGHSARGLKCDRDHFDLLNLALHPEHPVIRASVSLSRVKGLLIDSGLQCTALNRLHDYMSVKYNIPDSDEFLRDDENWLQAVLNIKLKPNTINTLSAWLLH